jgi:hypothetical protein
VRKPACALTCGSLLPHHGIAKLYEVPDTNVLPNSQLASTAPEHVTVTANSRTHSHGFTNGLTCSRLLFGMQTVVARGEAKASQTETVASYRLPSSPFDFLVW